MNAFGVFMLIAWIPISVIFFTKFSAQKAVILTVFGGFMFLPAGSMGSIVTNFPILPLFGKDASMCFALIIGNLFIKKNTIEKTEQADNNLLLLLYCFVVPFCSAFAPYNHLGINSAIIWMFDRILKWGVFFYFGRKYFHDEKSQKQLAIAMIYSGTIYALLCLYEIRMSPQLSVMVYGFFAHSWAQHVRNGGYRPIVFMSHGLVVSKWMAFSTLIAFSFYLKDKSIKIFSISLKYILLLLMITTVLTKSASGIVYLFLGIIIIYLYVKNNNPILLILLICIIPIYILVRTNGNFDIYKFTDFLSKYFPPERIQSLLFRFRMEEPMLKTAREHYLFGWGWFGLGLNLDDFSWLARNVIPDSRFIIEYQSKGMFGLAIMYLFLLAGPYLAIRYIRSNDANKELNILPFTISVIIVFSAFDFLMNATIGSAYFLFCGSLVGKFQMEKK